MLLSLQSRAVIALTSSGVFTIDQSATIALQEIKAFMRSENPRDPASILNVSLYVPEGQGGVIRHAVEQTTGYNTSMLTRYDAASQTQTYLPAAWTGAYGPRGSGPWQQYERPMAPVSGPTWDASGQPYAHNCGLFFETDYNTQFAQPYPRRLRPASYDNGYLPYRPPLDSYSYSPR